MFRGFWKKLKRPIIGLAPMDGVTDAAFRYIVAKCHKPDVMITEFTNVEGLARGASKMLVSFLYDEIERPIVGQLFGVEPESYYKCAIILCALGFDGIDINMGCPVNKVARKGSGAALIKTPKLALEIVAACKRGVRDWVNGISLEEADVHEGVAKEIQRFTSGLRSKSLRLSGPETLVGKSDPQCAPLCPALDSRFRGNDRERWNVGGRENNKKRKMIPVSIKTRIGYDEIVAEEWVKTLLEAEPANITMHGRTLRQMYMGKANWEILGMVARVVHESGLGVSFLGNGDVSSMEEACQKSREYGVDGVLVGRAVLGNPWFFSGKEVTLKDRLKMLLDHACYFSKLLHLPFFNIRKHLGWYCKGFEGAKEWRMRLMQVNNLEEVERIVKEVQKKF